MSGDRLHASVAVNMERIDVNGLIMLAGQGTVDPTEKIAALFDRTDWFHDWRSYRVAYGRQDGWKSPSFVQWASPITAEYDPTVQELFSDVNLEIGESYFLLISRFDVNQTHAASSQRAVDFAINRFPTLYSQGLEMPAVTVPVAGLGTLLDQLKVMGCSR
jgi:hypothetical protein